MNNTDVLLTPGELALRHREKPQTLRAKRVRGGGVPFLKLGGHVRYRLEDVVRYEQAHTFNSTSEANPGPVTAAASRP